MHKINIEDKVINITHANKILFPKINLTKMDLINYYIKVADYLLPYVKNRPITIQCFPEGVDQKGFYRQHAFNSLPSWFETVSLKNKYGVYIEHLLCQDKASLIYLANYNMISMLRCLSKIEDSKAPDLFTIGIIPPENTSFNLVCKAAKLLRTQLEIKSYKPHVMTTGGNGLIVISKVKQGDNYITIKDMLFKLVAIIMNEYPTEFSINVRKNKRIQLVYIDIMHNSHAQSVITPFSIIVGKCASIATPLSWEELDHPESILNKCNIKDIFIRLNHLVKDPWIGIEL
ncbi:MAG: hypothetical protein JKY53_13185 [Flavobacteriales bacterium]|nr:hypothetical protein [Flavobacteriales bacterium]